MAFWDIFRRKKKDEFGLAGLQESGFRKDELGLPAAAPELGMPNEPSMNEPSYGRPTPEAFKEIAQGPSAPSAAGISSRDIELLSSKLDTVKAMLDNISNRLAIIEKQFQEEKTKSDEKRRIGWYA